MGETVKTREQLTQELAQAQKRIAELEAGLVDSGKPQVNYGTLKTFFDSATDSFSIWDSNLNMVYLNDVTLTKYYPPGTKRADVIGKHFTELVAGSVESERYKQYLNVLKTGEPFYLDVFNPHPKYGDMYLAIRVFKIEDGLGIITIDISEHKRMEQALQDSQQRLSALIDNAPDVIFTYDTSGRFVSGNKRAEELMGYTREEMLGKTFAESGILTEESLAKTKQSLDDYKQGKPAEPTPYELITKDGTHIFMEVRGVPIVQGDKVEVIAIARDITKRKRAEEALRQSEERLRTYFENAPDAIFVYDFNGVFLDGNRMGEEITGYRKTELVGRNFIESGLFSEQYALKAMSAVLKDLKGEISGPEEYEITRKDGQKRVLESTSFVVKGQWKGEVVGIARDVTERKKMEEELRQSEEKLRAILESIGNSITVIDTKGNITDLNDAAMKLFGCKDREEALGMNALTFMAEDSQPSATVKLNAAKTERLVQYKFKRMDGSTFWGETSTDAIHNSSGEITGFVAIIMDITERKALEDKLRQNEEKIRQIFNYIGVGITVTDMDGKIVEMNDVGLRLCGYDKGELLGRNGISIIAERDRPRIVETMIRAFETGQSETNEFTSLKADGAEYEVEAIATVVRDYSGNPEGLIISITDITERKRIERELNNYKANLEKMVQKRTTELEKTYKELQESEEKYRSLVEQLNQGILIMQDNRIVFANNAMTQINGYSINEMLAMSPQQVINIGHPENRGRLAKRIDERMQGKSIPKYSEWPIIRKDGTERWLETLATRIIFNGKPAIQATLLDITERKKMENALKNSEEKLRTMFTSMADGVVVTDLKGNFKDANAVALHMFGYSSKEDIRDANGFDFIAEKDRDLAMSDMAQLFSEGLVTGRSWTFKHSSGSKFQAELSTALLKDAKDNPTEIMVVMRDITTRKRIEESLRESEEKLRVMFSSIADGIVVTDIEGNIKDLNDAQLHLFGYDRKEDALGENGFDFVEDKDRLTAMKDMSLLIEKGTMAGSSWAFVDRRGNAFKAEVSASLMRDSSGNPTDVIVVVRDVTERKRMEEALRESEAKLRAIYDSIGDGITVTDLKGIIIDENEAGLRLSGYSRKADVAGRNGLSFIAEADRDRARNDMFNVLQKGFGITTEYKLINRNGKEFDAEVSGAVINDGEGKPTAIVNVIRDVTERKRIEEALIESEEKYRTLVEQSEQGICILQDGRIAFANNALAKINGYSLKEMHAMSPDEYLLTIHPGDREEFATRVRKRLQGDKMVSRHEYRTIRKDGAERHLETYTKRITYKGKPAIQSTVSDITERKQWEVKLKESKEELRFYLNQITKAQEEERKKIARELHDDTIQELITLSRQIDDLVDRNIKPDEDRRSSRKKIAAARQKVDTILKSVRRFTRDLRPSILDDLGLVPALEWLTTDTSERFGVPINISVVGTEHPATPDAALAMFRIAQESLRNAGQHSKASQIQLNLKYSSKTATLSIIDNGVGFTPPKQTTSLTRIGKLGIAGMYERAQLIGATLSIKSKRNKGTTVTLEVPIK